jgi:sugar phosphate isomerase/epimerase
MKFATNVWYGDRPLRPAFERAYRLGFDFIEFSLDYPWPDQLKSEEIRLLEKLKEEYGLGITFHGPWSGHVIFHPRDEISDACLRIYEKCLKFVEGFNPLYFNFHQFGYVTTSGFEEIRKKIFNKALETTRMIVNFGRGFPVTIENNPSRLFGCPRDIKLLLDKISDLNFCFDVGHAVVSKWEIQQAKGRSDEKLEIEDWLDLFKDRILAVHLHDCLFKSNLKPVDHLVIGKGNLNFENIIRAVKKTSCRYVVLETFYTRKGVYASEEDLKNNLEFCRGLIR